MAKDLKGKVVLVTGASTGIGAAVARAFAHHGCKVAVHCNANVEKAREVAADVQACGVDATVVRGDVTRGEEVKRIVAEVLDVFGRIDVLVNNVGSMVERRRIEEYDDDYLARVLQVNVVQVAMFMREVIPGIGRGSQAT